MIKRNKNIFFLLLFVLLNFCVYLYSESRTTSYIKNDLSKDIVSEIHFLQKSLDTTISRKEEVLKYLLIYDVEHPDIVLKQAIIESGHFKSDLYIKYNNPFGMKYPTVRYTTSYGQTENGYAAYNSVELAILDYKSWQNANAKGLSREEYYNVLSKVYAEDKSYVSKIKKLKIEN